MKGCHSAASIAAFGLALAVTGCAAPSVSDLPGHDVHEENGIPSVSYDPEGLSGLVLPVGVERDFFELGDHSFSAGFDRVAVRWEALAAGGDATIEVQVDGAGAWLPVTATHSEFVPESGYTLHAGYVDVQAGARSIRGRLELRRPADSLDAASPQLAGLDLQVFVADEVAEVGDGTPVDETEGDEFDLPDGAVGFGNPGVITRATWGARAPKCNGAAHTPYRMTFHHTVTPNGDTGATARARMRQMQAYHQDSLGWCDIGYHFSVDAAGKIYRGRTSTSRTGSHVGNQNSGNIGISLMGTFTTVTPGALQLGGLMDGFAWMADYWNIPVSADRIRGHRQWAGQSTSCPGDKTLAKKTVILQGITTRLNGTPPPPPPPTSDTIIIDNPSTLFGASGNWWTGTSQSDRYGSNYRVRSTDGVSDTAEWKASLENRNYEVYVWYSQGSNRASAAPYFVYHKNGTTKKYVDQTKDGGRWVSLGTYGFSGGTAPRVGLSCWTGSGQFVIADAVKLVPR